MIIVHTPDGRRLELTEEEYRVFKRGKSAGEPVEMETCENCHAKKVKGRICRQCGHSFRIG